MIATVEWPKWASRDSAMHGFPPTLSVWGPSQARIASNSRDLLSRLLFADTRVELEF